MIGPAGGPFPCPKLRLAVPGAQREDQAVPDSNAYPVRKLVDLGDGVAEILFPDVDKPDLFVGVVSPQGGDHAAGVHTRGEGGKHALVLLDGDDTAAMARRLLQLAVSPDDDKRARAALRRMIDVSTGPEQIIDRLLEHFEIFPRANV
jgi:hypothetical protein